MLVLTFGAIYLLLRIAVTNRDPSQVDYPQLKGETILHVTRCLFYAGLISLLNGVGFWAGS